VIKRHAEPPEVWKKYLESATECQRQIKCSAENETFATKCSGVLEDLQAEAVSAIKNAADGDRASSWQERDTGEPAHGTPASFFGYKWDDMNLVSPKFF
jgi:hypothetical protein